MKNSLMLIAIFTLVSCSKVPAGFVGLKVNMLGSDRGKGNIEVLEAGRYWVGMNEELFTFPTFTQNYTWTKSPTEGSTNDESITFQTMEGMSVNADLGISYSINPEKVKDVFLKYRKGVAEITDIYLRNSVRNAMNELASTMSVEEVYGSKKGWLINETQKKVAGEVGPIGLNIEKVYLINAMRLPESVANALNAKIEATQLAQKAQNEVLKARAEAEKQVALAKGEAEANRIRQASISDQLIKYEAVRKWNGVTPTVTSGAIPFIDITSK